MPSQTVRAPIDIPCGRDERIEAILHCVGSVEAVADAASKEVIEPALAAAACSRQIERGSHEAVRSIGGVTSRGQHDTKSSEAPRARELVRRVSTKCTR